jgi:hypothetical protein
MPLLNNNNIMISKLNKIQRYYSIYSSNKIRAERFGEPIPTVEELFDQRVALIQALVEKLEARYGPNLSFSETDNIKQTVIEIEQMLEKYKANPESFNTFVIREYGKQLSAEGEHKLW